MSYHDPKGFREAREWARAQAAAEVARIGAVKARGVVPDDCGPEIPEAPARGAYQVVRPQKLYPDGRDGYVAKDAGYLGRAALRHADAFDVMRVAAAKRKKPAPFSETQVAMGRHYRDLVERHATAGIRGSSFTRTRTGGTGQSGAFIDALMQDRQEIDRLHRKIGPGTALEVRRVRPSDRGTRSAIPDRALVDMVCIGDKPSAMPSIAWSDPRISQRQPRSITGIRRSAGRRKSRAGGMPGRKGDRSHSFPAPSKGRGRVSNFLPFGGNRRGTLFLRKVGIG